MAFREPSPRWKRLVVPAVVLPLLLLQLLVAFHGFDRPHGGLLGLLESPAILLGWGGVALLVVLSAWLFAGWWGRDLFGLEGAHGLAIRLTGCLTLAVAVAGLAGLVGVGTGGGRIGRGLAEMLAGSPLGTVGAALVLLVLLAPGLLLSVSPFLGSGRSAAAAGSTSPSVRPSLGDLADLEPPPGLYQGQRSAAPGGAHPSSYPERRFDEEGNEIPMVFPGRDVGPVRFVGEEPDEEHAATAPEARPPAPVEVSEEELPEGVRFADEAPPEVAPAESEAASPATRYAVPLPPGVRFADEPPAAGEEKPDEEEPPGEADDAGGGAEAAAVAPREPEPDSHDGSPPQPEPDARPPAKTPAFAPAPVAVGEGPPPKLVGDVGLESLRDEEAGAQYRQKLEGSGIFDEPPPTPPPARPPRPKKTKPRREATAEKPAGSRKKPREDAKTSVAAAGGRKAKSKPKSKAKKAPTSGGGAAGGTQRTRKAPRKGARTAPAARDETYRRAVEVALERGAASSVLLSRRLDIGYAQARKLIETLVEDGILGEMTPSGSRPLLVTPEEWKKRG